MVNITDGEILSLDHQFEFWGEAYNYRNVQSIKLKGRITDTTSGTAPVTSIWGQTISFSESLPDYETIQINGTTIGQGRVTSINYGGGRDARFKPYEINLEILKTGDLFNFVGYNYDTDGLYTGVSAANIEAVESLTEDFAFDYSEEDGVYSYNRQLSISIESGQAGDPVATAKSLANTFFFNDPLAAVVNANYPNFYVGEGDKIRTETYDLQNHSFSFDESFAFQNNNPYTWSYTHATTLERAETTVSEQGLVVGVNTNPSIGSNALAGFTNDIKPNIYTRCNNIYRSWSGVISDSSLDGCSLQELPFNRSISYDQFNGTVNYSYTYTTSASRSGCFMNQKSSNISRGEDGVFSVSVQGNICDKCGTDTTRFSNTKAEFQSAAFQSDILASAMTAYTNGTEGLACSDDFPKDLTRTSTANTYDEQQGCISYNYNYSDKESLSADGDYIDIQINRDTTYPVHFVNKFRIINEKEAVQKANQSVEAIYSNKITVTAREDKSLNALIAKASSYVKQPVGGAEDIHVADADYTWSPDNKTLNLNVAYRYYEHREFEDVLVW